MNSIRQVVSSLAALAHCGSLSVIQSALAMALWLAGIAFAQNFTPQLSVPQPHLLQITQIAVPPEGSWIATAGQDATICIWNAADGRFLAKYDPQLSNGGGMINAIAAISVPRRVVYSFGFDLVTLDADTFTVLGKMKTPEIFSWLHPLPDGSLWPLHRAGFIVRIWAILHRRESPRSRPAFRVFPSSQPAKTPWKLPHFIPIRLATLHK